MTDHESQGAAPEATQTDTPSGGSREAMLGADGLRFVKAVATVPARPPRKWHPARPAFTDPRGDRGMSPNASREAGFGGVAPEPRPAGGLAIDDEPDGTPAPQDNPYPAGDKTLDPE